MLTELEKIPETDSEADAEVLAVVFPETYATMRRPAVDNPHRRVPTEYQELVLGEDSLGLVTDFATRLERILADSNDTALQLASIHTCINLSQAFIRILLSQNHDYPVTDLKEYQLPDLHEKLGAVVREMTSDSALVSLIQKDAVNLFDAYIGNPAILVHDTSEDYETDYLGPILPLYQSEGLGQEPELIEGQPTLFARDMVGYRDTSGYISLTAPIDQADIDQKIEYSVEQYREMDYEYLTFLSSSDNYYSMDDTMRRTTIIRDVDDISQVTNGRDVDQIQLFQEIHRPYPRTVLEKFLGVNFKDIPLEDQFALLSFSATRDDASFEKLSTVMQAIEKSERPAFFGAFLATEFGEDFGDSLLTIAEHATPEQSKEIIEAVNTFRRHTKRIASWYKEYDPQLTADYEKAMNERLTDLIAALEVLARDGTLSVDVSPGRHADDYKSDGRFEMNIRSLAEGIEIVRSLEKSFQLIGDVVTAPDTQVHRVNKDAAHFAMYRFSSEEHGDALLYVRPEGAHGYDSHLEYGTRKGVEASISFIVNPTDPHHLNAYKDPQGVSVRFDREGRMTDESPFAQDRDPTRANGSMSVDISSLMGDGRHMPVKIGRMVAAGNILRAAKTGGEESLHHNNNYFNQSVYGNARGFSNLAIYTMRTAEAMIAIQKYGDDAVHAQSILANLRSK